MREGSGLPGARLRAFAAAILLTAGAAAFAAEQTGFPQIRIATGARAPAGPGAKTFLAELRAGAARRDLVAVTALVSDGFRWDRDFGGGYRSDADAATNFIAALQLDDSLLLEPNRDRGWRRLSEMLAARSIGDGGEDGEICAPAAPRFRSSADQARADAIDGFDFDFGYVEATEVNVRARAGLDQIAVDSVSAEAVRILAGKSADDLEPDWIKVETARGAQGYVAARFVESFLADRICFGLGGNGSWEITAYVGGGD